MQATNEMIQAIDPTCMPDEPAEWEGSTPRGIVNSVLAVVLEPPFCEAGWFDVEWKPRGSTAWRRAFLKKENCPMGVDLAFACDQARKWASDYDVQVIKLTLMREVVSGQDQTSC